jgi:SAM-dependent methyltransferase
MAYLDFITGLHTSSKRNYLQRVCEDDKAACATLAKQWDVDYWDGDRSTGYGGYNYDGRWQPVAKKMAEHYGLRAGNRVLDVGCGKAFLLYDFTLAVEGIEIAGIDISSYAIAHAKEEARPYLDVGNANHLPYPDNSFDLVYSINTLHNLYVFDLMAALKEIERVSRGGKYVVVESYRTEQEKVNLMYWQLTCESFYTPDEWEWVFAQAGYTGDHGLIFFE